MSRGIATDREEVATLRARAAAAETALTDARLLILDLSAQLDAANAAAVRLAQRIVRSTRQMRAA